MYDLIVDLLLTSGSLHPTPQGGSLMEAHHPGGRPVRRRPLGPAGLSAGPSGSFIRTLAGFTRPTSSLYP